MSNTNSSRQSCKDVFNAFLVKEATYSGLFEIPNIQKCRSIPNKLISFSKCINSKDYDSWVHFYQDDFSFERIWRNPKRYLKILKRFNGVILPDFSLYRDMPLVMQIWNIYRSRAIGCWLQKNDILVIPNIRYGDERTFRLSCCGIEKNSVIAIGSNGTYQHNVDKAIFDKGLDVVIKSIEPIAIIIYGSLSKKLQKICNEKGIALYHFESDVALSHKGVV